MAKKSKKEAPQVAETPEPRVVEMPKIIEPQVVETPKPTRAPKIAKKHFEFKPNFIRR